MSKNVSKKLALAALECGALSLNTKSPFRWASGYFMPVYNDNRLLLGSPDNRKLVSEGLAELCEGMNPNLISGCATAGIAPALGLADLLSLPFGYVRSKAKEHGRKQLIEGTAAEGKKVIVVEDLISTGGSSLKVVEILREAKAEVLTCISIFSYGFSKASDAFEQANCPTASILSLDQLLEAAHEIGAVGQGEIESIKLWQQKPFEWGEINGFPAEVNN
jgi:orotate phosphoribosyltransferase